MKAGWRIGTLFGIPLFIDPSWFFILLAVTFAYTSEWETYNITGIPGWILGFCMAMLLFASVLMHELGHSLVALSQGITVNSITLFLFGGIASIERESNTPGQAFQVAIAGPAVSFGLFLGLGLTAWFTAIDGPTHFILRRLATINLILAIFNMMPGLPLDGGQVFKALIWKVTGNRIKGVRWAARTGQALGWTAIAFGIFLYLTTFEPTLIWLALIGWFGIRNARAYGRVADIQDIMLKFKAADVMRRDFRVVDANLSAQTFIEQYLSEAPQDSPYFAASSGRYRGQLVIREIQQIERSQWSTLTLHDIAVPLLSIPHVYESTPLADIIHQLDIEELSHVTVLSPADAVAGVIDRTDITRLVAQQLNLPLSPETVQYIQDTQHYPPGLQLSQIAKTIAYSTAHQRYSNEQEIKELAQESSSQ